MFQGIQLALNCVHLSVDVLLGDVLVSLDLPDNAPVTRRTAYPSHLPAARSFAISLASTGFPGPRAWALSRTPAWPRAGSRCG